MRVLHLNTACTPDSSLTTRALGPSDSSGPAYPPSSSGPLSPTLQVPRPHLAALPLQLAASKELTSLLHWAPPEPLVCQDQYQILDCCRCKAEVGERERWKKTNQPGWQTNPAESPVTTGGCENAEKGGSLHGRPQPTAFICQPSWVIFLQVLEKGGIGSPWMRHPSPHS